MAIVTNKHMSEIIIPKALVISLVRTSSSRSRSITEFGSGSIKLILHIVSKFLPKIPSIECIILPEFFQNFQKEFPERFVVFFH